MAARIGVPDDVIRKARARINDDDARLEGLLRQVEADSQQIASERAALEQELAAVRQERSEAESSLRTARDEARSIKAKARLEAKEVVAALRQRLRELSRSAALEQAEVRKTSADVEAQLGKLDPEAGERDYDAPAEVPDLHPGDRVRIPRWNRAATVLASRRGLLELEMDGKKLKLSAQEVLPIEPLRRQQSAYTAPGWGAELHEQEGATDRLNIIGLRVDEGLAEVERFIDRAGTRGHSIVTIIHGLGTGALKAAITEYLKNHPQIAVLRSGEPAEGGAGVTVVELKK
jgi:DNA mismatch repair protein MutS2